MSQASHFRRSAREPVELRVRFRRDTAEAALETAGRLVDLGMGGAQIACERPPGPDEGLRVELAAPTAWDPLLLSARVKWVDEEAKVFGVAFASLSPGQATALYELLAISRFDRPAAARSGE